MKEPACRCSIHGRRRPSDGRKRNPVIDKSSYQENGAGPWARLKQHLSAAPSKHGETSMTASCDLIIRSALELAGIEFIDENGGGPGV